MQEAGGFSRELRAQVHELLIVAVANGIETLFQTLRRRLNALRQPLGATCAHITREFLSCRRQGFDSRLHRLTDCLARVLADLRQCLLHVIANSHRKPAQKLFRLG